MSKKSRSKLIINICLIIFFVVCVVVPIISMLCRITPEGFNQVFSSGQFGLAVKNSVTTAFTATIISLLLSLFAALCLERTSIRLKAVFGITFIIPMLIPSISHAFGLVTLFGTNGIFTNILNLNTSIYGFWGIVIGSVMYSFAIAFLMFSSILQYEDGMVYKASDVLGIPPFRRFTDITLPFMKKTIISAFFVVFTMIVTDYGIPLMIGGKMITLSVLMYNKAVSMIDYDAGSVIGACLLIPAVIAFMVDVINPEKTQNEYVMERVVPERKTMRSVISYLFCTVISIAVLSPIIAFCVMIFEKKYPIDTTFTLYHVEKTINQGADTYLLNSLIYSILTAAIGTCLAFICSYLSTRYKSAFGKVLHLISITSMAIPGIVLGLSYVVFFHDSIIYGTIVIVILVNSVHFFASPYLMMYNTLLKINPNLEDVGYCLGIKRFAIIKDVIIPKVKYTLAEMFVYFFVNSMMTISAVSFLAPPSPKPIALMINQFEAQLLMGSAAFVSLLILGINLLIKIIMSIIRRGEEVI